MIESSPVAPDDHPPRSTSASAARAGTGLREVIHLEQVMGTVASFRVLSDASEGALDEALRAASAHLHLADGIFSTWKPESPLSRLRRGEISIADMPPEFHEVLGLCEEARAQSRGWFDPWAMPGGLDPTGLVKGWAGDKALAMLQSALVRTEGQGARAAGMLNLGGDIATFGSPRGSERWRIGVRSPTDPGELACVIEVDAAVATSGTYERGPILVDPFSGRRSSRAASATVTGPSLAICDALATGLAVAGEEGMEWFASLEGYEALLILEQGGILVTDEFRLAAEPTSSARSPGPSATAWSAVSGPRPSVVAANLVASEGSAQANQSVGHPLVVVEGR